VEVPAKCHESLLKTLRIIESKITDQTQLLISYVKTKVSRDNKITDSATLEKVTQLIKAFDDLIDEIHQ
jgi:hypothetical protein